METKDTVYTVTEVTRAIKAQLETTFPQLWVEGEISNFKHHSSGHMYFTLKDRQSQLRCVMFRGLNTKLQFQPEHGMKVFAFGHINVYEFGGYYQLNVRIMRPGGLGVLNIEFERIKKKLQQEGLFDPQNKKALPFLPRTIGIITSPTGAAIRDMLHVLRRRDPAVEVRIYPVRVQGEGAAEEIAEALDEMNRIGGCDLLITGRGGGSLEDLWPFNQEVVARAIFRSRIPVISAVGHEVDFTISDFVADHRAATPSAAAELAVPVVADVLRHLETVARRIGRALQNRIETYALRLDRLSSSRLFQPERLVKDRMEDVQRSCDKLQHRMQTILEQKKNQLRFVEGKLSVLDPLAVLHRGYSVTVRERDNAIVKRIEDVETGERIKILLAEGRLTAGVEAKDKQ